MDHLGLFEDNNNLMMQTKKVKDMGGDPSKATYLKNEQIREMQQKYIQDKLNHNSPVVSNYGFRLGIPPLYFYKRVIKK